MLLHIFNTYRIVNIVSADAVLQNLTDMYIVYNIHIIMKTVFIIVHLLYYIIKIVYSIFCARPLALQAN